MKSLFIFTFLAIALTSFAGGEIATNAALPENKLIWPLPKLDVADLITVEARFAGQKEICAFVQGNWITTMYLVKYAVSDGEKFPGKEISFVAQDVSPARESGIMVKKLPWPFHEGTLTFYLEKDRESKISEFFRILSYSKKD